MATSYIRVIHMRTVFSFSNNGKTQGYSNHTSEELPNRIYLP